MNDIRKLVDGVYINKNTNDVIYVINELRLKMRVFEIRETGLSQKKIAEYLGIKSRDVVRGILENKFYKKYYMEVHKNGSK